MIKRLSLKKTDALYDDFANQLKTAKFSGDIELSYGERTVLATDNSIYQVLPEGALYPRSTEDISTIMTLANKPEFQEILFSPRGGGTGTNGQSLTSGFMIDTSRYMDQVLESNSQQRWARVQAGVVKDYLNEQIVKAGLFFAPELSTSNRATIGGMVNTDASGQGSVIHGKTCHHVLELTSVLTDGTVLHSSPVDNEQLDKLCQRQDRIGNIYNTLKNTYCDHKERISQVFPDLNRSMTGYDLAHIVNKDGQYDINRILCGSEGTLAIISEIKVNLTPIPKASSLVIVCYRDFLDSLYDAQALMAVKPDSIETIDSRILELARSNNIWESVKDLLPFNDHLGGINFVEFTGESEAIIHHSIERLKTELKKPTLHARLGHKVITNRDHIKTIWNMRKHAVGLLGNMKGNARPIPFVEDVAVPPENLAQFITEFRSILDKHSLSYGMFGHVDAGVLHVRPAIDMKDPLQEKLVRLISDEVVSLVISHGGILWGEHGKGVRSEYAPTFFGELYPVLQQIKSVFDPNNQLNPGKIATPEKTSEPIQLLKIDEVPTRGQHDREIDRNTFEAFSGSLYCNGNGACFNYNPNSAMCPTWKATSNRTQSPKGRSGLVREWLRLQTTAGADIADEIKNIRRAGFMLQWLRKWINGFSKLSGKEDFGHQVYDALDSCMSCKSCAGQCPIQVNIPDLRSQYFELYHSRYPRPLKHHVAGLLEHLLPSLAKFRSMYNLLMSSSVMNKVAGKVLGLQDIPRITSSSPMNDYCQAGANIASPSLLDTLSESERAKSIIIIQDAFTSFFETPLVCHLIEFLVHLGYRPLIAPYRPNGKVLHVYGFLGRFEKIARTNGNELNKLANTGVSLVGVDAAVTLTYRDEYKTVMGENSPKVLLLSEWFAKESATLRQLQIDLSSQCTEKFVLLGHCTETTNEPAAPAHWQQLYRDLGLELTYKATGCCGMSGIYGHETHNQTISRKLYDMSWNDVVQNTKNNTTTLVATGYSCRSQVKRYSGDNIPHPIQPLLELIKQQSIC